MDESLLSRGDRVSPNLTPLDPSIKGFSLTLRAKYINRLIASLPDPLAILEIKQILYRIRCIKKYNKLYTRLYNALKASGGGV